MRGNPGKVAPVDELDERGRDTVACFFRLGTSACQEEAFGEVLELGAGIGFRELGGDRILDRYVPLVSASVHLLPVPGTGRGHAFAAASRARRHPP